MSYQNFQNQFSGPVKIQTPWGAQTFDIPYEQIVNQALDTATKRAQQELPKFVNQALDTATQRAKKELPGFVDEAVNEAKPTVREEIDRAILIARRELNQAMNTGTKRATLIASGLAVIFIASTLWLRAGIKKGQR